MTEPEEFTEAHVHAMVGRYTLVIVFIIALFLILLGCGWPWWIAGLGPILLIPLCAVSFSMALAIKMKLN